MSSLEKLYAKYDYLAQEYARKINNPELYGYEREDIVQEFRLKIYTSIMSYAKRFAEYKATGKYEPVPLEFYLRSALNNHKKDYFAKFGKSISKNSMSIQNVEFDVGIDNNLDLDFTVCLKTKQMVIGGFDCLKGLSDVERQAFLFYTHKGMTLKEIDKLFSKKYGSKISNFVSRHKKKVIDDLSNLGITPNEHEYDNQEVIYHYSFSND